MRNILAADPEGGHKEREKASKETRKEKEAGRAYLGKESNIAPTYILWVPGSSGFGQSGVRLHHHFFPVRKIWLVRFDGDDPKERLSSVEDNPHLVGLGSRGDFTPWAGRGMRGGVALMGKGWLEKN